MKLKDASRASIDPRCVIEGQGIDGLAMLLSEVGYVPQRRILKDLRNSLRSRKPLLIEGPRGGGKTELAEALAAACNLTVFYLQGTEELTLADVLYSWDREEQRELVREERHKGTAREERQRMKYSREFLILGEALGAFDYAEREEVPPILIIDEADKLTEKIEDMLLQLLGRGWASVPRIEGNIGVTDPAKFPIVMLLSNNIRHELSAPLRSRCIYNWLEPPTPLEEVRILKKRVPEADPTLLAQVAKVISHIRLDMPQVRDKPGLRESIDLLKILVLDGVKEVTAEVIEEYVSFLGKKPKELASLTQGTARLEWAARMPDAEIDGWIIKLYEQESEGVFKEAA